MNPSRILITGGTGLLGKTLLETAPSGWDVQATHHLHEPPAGWAGRFHPLDLREADSIGRLIQNIRPDAVIHTASIGSVDQAEQDPAGVRAVNVEGTRFVAQACRRAGAFLVHISSNAVFDGLHPPYSEESQVCPANRYGQIKLEAEEAVQVTGAAHLIIRPILMYGWPLPGGRENAVTRWLSQLEHGQTVKAARDIYSMPLSASNCAEAVWAGALRRETGILHVAGADRLSLADFARRVAETFGQDPAKVLQVASRDLPGLAPRPTDTSFVTLRMERTLGVRPAGVSEGLAGMLQRCAS